MKRFLTVLISVALLISISACIRGTVQETATDTDEAPEGEKNEDTPDVIDWSLLTLSEHLICSSYQRVFRNLPGMVLYADGNRLNYVNKKTGAPHLFCFDSLCDHQDCTAVRTPYAQYYIWSPADQCLYASGYDMMTAGNDGHLYRVDAATQEMVRVIEGNGNEWRQMFVNEKYIFLQRVKVGGGFEILRYDSIGGVCVTISPPEGRIFGDLKVSGDTVILSFCNEELSYVTDSDFSVYSQVPLSIGGIIYLDGTTAYVASDEEGHDVGRVNAARKLYRYDLNTGERTLLLSVENVAFDPVGFDGSYIYYLRNPLKKEMTDRIAEYGDALYRVSVNDGRDEMLVNFDIEHTGFAYELYVYEACCYDGVVYCNVKSEGRAHTTEHFGTIVKNADGAWCFQMISSP